VETLHTPEYVHVPFDVANCLAWSCRASVRCHFACVQYLKIDDSYGFGSRK
jgi:hypothetical protein